MKPIPCVTQLAAILALPLCLIACSIDHTDVAPSTTSPPASSTAPHILAADKIENPGTAKAGSGSPHEAFTIRMHRSGCFGRCPSYSVQIASDGAVDFTGERYVVAGPGLQQGRADPAGLAALQTMLADPAVAALKDDYTPANQKACGLMATDFPSVSIDITTGAFPRHINHYLGCEGSPGILKALEQAIDDAAATSRWISATPDR